MKKFLLRALVLTGITATAQVKVGNNPTTLATDAKFQVEGSTGAQTVILDNGNVGIGTTTPSSIFNIENNNISNSSSGLFNRYSEVITTPNSDPSAISARHIVNGTFNGYTSYRPVALAGQMFVSGSVSLNATYGLRGMYVGGHSGLGATSHTGRVSVAIGTGGEVFDYSTGASILDNAQAFRANVQRIGTAGIIRNARGLFISGVQALGTDAGFNHTAMGIHIANGISASGGDTNSVWSIYSDSTAPSYFRGRIGIGTTAPEQQLEINNSTTNTEMHISRGNVGSKYRMKLTQTNTYGSISSYDENSSSSLPLLLNPNGGAVTVGLNTPVTNGHLHINGGSTTIAGIADVVSSNSMNTVFQSPNPPQRLGIGYLPTPYDGMFIQSYNVSNSDAKYMSINPFGGSIGIGTGTTAPTARLEVAGSIKVGNDGDTATNGTIRYNTSTNKFQGYANGAWVDLH